MLRHRWLKWIALAAALVSTVVVTRISLMSAGSKGEWLAFGGDLASTHYSPADQITKDVKNLKVVWRQSLTPDAVKQGRTVPPPPTTNQTTPLMIGGLV